MFIASNNQTMKLYWVTTQDHDEDWFVFAESARQARAFHEDCEGYDKGDAHSRLIVSKVTLKEFQNGVPPCHAQFQDLFQIGFKNAGTTPNRRGVKFNGEIFREGILEAIIELGRKQMAAVMRENGCLERGEASSYDLFPGLLACKVVRPPRDSRRPYSASGRPLLQPLLRRGELDVPPLGIGHTDPLQEPATHGWPCVFQYFKRADRQSHFLALLKRRRDRVEDHIHHRLRSGAAQFVRVPLRLITPGSSWRDRPH